MAARLQRTIARTAEVAGFGLFGSANCRLRLIPADANAGIAFHRVDIPGSRPIPATTEFVLNVPRRTAISDGHSTVEMIEHVMAALAGLWIDNCTVELDAPEPPVGDGSSIHIVEAILKAGIVEQSTPARIIEVPDNFSEIAPAQSTPHDLVVGTEPTQPAISASPAPHYDVSYTLDYGPGAPIPPHRSGITVTPEAFVNQIAAARTFVLASEIEGLRKMGFGRRVNTSNLLVVEADGSLRDNAVRWPDEFARHKVLDAIGDLALCGYRIAGRIEAHRTGHHLNQSLAARLRNHIQKLQPEPVPRSRAA